MWLLMFKQAKARIIKKNNNIIIDFLSFGRNRSLWMFYGRKINKEFMNMYWEVIWTEVANP